MKVTKIAFAKGSFQKPTLATLIIIRKSTQTGTPTGCCISSMKNLNGFLNRIISVNNRGMKTFFLQGHFHVW